MCYFRTSSIFFELAVLVDVFEVFADGSGVDVEEAGDLGLGGPDSAGIGIDFELDVFAASFVNDDLLVVAHDTSL